MDGLTVRSFASLFIVLTKRHSRLKMFNVLNRRIEDGTQQNDLETGGILSIKGAAQPSFLESGEIRRRFCA